MDFAAFKSLIRNGASDQVRDALRAQPDLLHTHDPSDDQWDQRTAMHCAARYGHLDMIKFFVEQGAEVYSNPMNSYPPIFVADCYRHHPDRPNAQHVVDYFLREIPEKADGTQRLGITINLAARAGWTEIVRRHLEIDPLAVHQRGWIGDTPLHWSSHNGHVDIVELLLDSGANINADEINCYGGKPLHWASEHEPSVVELLLARGADVNARNERRESDYFGVTPLLMNALMKDDCAEVTELLLAAGADTSITFQGKTASAVAAKKGNQAILAVLESHAK